MVFCKMVAILSRRNVLTVSYCLYNHHLSAFIYMHNVIYAPLAILKIIV